jgi:hypothetical protein
MPNTLLIVTNSFDGSTDVLVQLAQARQLPVFRLNTDLLGSYQIHLDAQGFVLRDETGRSVASGEVMACYYRKPWKGGDDPWVAYPHHEQTWVRGQLRRMVREIINLCRLKGKLRLVEPQADLRLDKLTQMHVAKRYFTVPGWEYVWHVAAAPGQRVTKPLDPEQLGAERARFVFTEVVEASRLAAGYPWLVQDVAQGTRDATVVYIAGQCFGFRIARDRASGPTDWRERINTDAQDVWQCYDVSPEIVHGCQRFMADVGLHYGRFDFIIDDDGRHEFLEVNSNGQYGWLDDVQESWLHTSVLNALLNPATTIGWPSLARDLAS